jgi:RNase P/RNase MRP subunit POP5
MAAWMKQPLRKSFNSMIAAVDESREKKEKLKRVAKLMQNVKNKWRDICFCEWSALKNQVSDRNKRVLDKMKGFMGNYTLELCRSVILAWSEQQKKTKRAMMCAVHATTFAFALAHRAARQVVEERRNGARVVGVEGGHQEEASGTRSHSENAGALPAAACMLRVQRVAGQHSGPHQPKVRDC